MKHLVVVTLVMALVGCRDQRMEYRDARQREPEPCGRYFDGQTVVNIVPDRAPVDVVNPEPVIVVAHTSQGPARRLYQRDCSGLSGCSSWCLPVNGFLHAVSVRPDVGVLLAYTKWPARDDRDPDDVYSVDLCPTGVKFVYSIMEYRQSRRCVAAALRRYQDRRKEQSGERLRDIRERQRLARRDAWVDSMVPLSPSHPPVKRRNNGPTRLVLK